MLDTQPDASVASEVGRSRLDLDASALAEGLTTMGEGGDVLRVWTGPALVPLAGTPCGQDPSALDEFDKLRTFALSLRTRDQPRVSWVEVGQLAGMLLASVAKDLRVACWGTLGLYRAHRFEGLAAGLTVIRKLHADWWNEMFPLAPPERARLNALASTMERLCGWVVEDPPVAADSQYVSTCLASLRDLRARATEVYERRDELSPLANLESLLSDAATLAGVAVASVRGTVPTPVPVSVDPKAEVADLRKRLPELARALLLKRASNPTAFRLLRVAVWLEPVTPMEGRLSIAGPERADAEARIKELDALTASEESVRKLEGWVAKQPYWLDLQPAVCRVLHQLGKEYADAERVVKAECEALVARVPELPESVFGKDTAVASLATRTWFRSLRGSAETAPAPTALSLPAEDKNLGDRAVQLAVDEARQKASNGQVGEALGVLSGAMARTAHAPARVRLRLELGRLLLEQALDDAACVHLESVEAELSTLRVEDWDHALLHETLALLWSAYQRLSEGPPDLAERRRRVQARLVRLDPPSAVALARQSQKRTETPGRRH